MKSSPRPTIPIPAYVKTAKVSKPGNPIHEKLKQLMRRHIKNTGWDKLTAAKWDAWKNVYFLD